MRKYSCGHFGTTPGINFSAINSDTNGKGLYSTVDDLGESYYSSIMIIFENIFLIHLHLIYK